MTKVGGFTKHSLIDFPSKVAAVVFYNGCNLRCGYCHNAALLGDTDESIQWESVHKYLSKYRKWLDGVVFSGGEATLHPELRRMIEETKALGLAVKLDTNGTRPAIVKDLLESRLLDYVAVDLKTTWDLYPTLGASTAQIDAIKETIGILHSFRSAQAEDQPDVVLELRTTMVPSLVTRKNFTELLKVVPHGIPLFLQQFVPTNALEANYREETTYSQKELYKFCKQGEKKQVDVHLRLGFTERPMH